MGAMKVHFVYTLKVSIVLLAGLVTRCACGQPQPSIFPVEHGVINLSTGALHLEIPIANYPQRGSIQQPITLVYDSNIWKANYDSSTDSSRWSPNAITPSGHVSSGGWYVSFGQQNQSMSYMPALAFNCADNPNNGGEVITGFSWIDQHGTTYVFPTVVTTGSDGPGVTSCTGTDGNTYTFTLEASAYAVDGSGYLGVVTFNPAQGSFFSLNVYDSDGSLVASNSFNQDVVASLGGLNVTNGPMLPVDRNGNTTSVINSIGQDTVGRTLLSDSGIVTETGIGSVEYLTVPVAGGGTATYTVNYKTIQVATSFGLSYVSDINQMNMLVVDSIALPDGSSYSFQYSENSYGELTGMTVPHGGQVTFSYSTAPGRNIPNEDKTTVLPSRWVQSHTGSDGTTRFQWSEAASTLYSEPNTTCNLIQNQVTTLSAQNMYKFSHCGGDILLREIDYGVANSAQIDAVDLYSYDATHPCPSWTARVFGDGFNTPPDFLYTAQPCTGLMWRNLTGKTTILLPPPGSNAQTLTTDTQYVYGNPGTGRPTSIKQWDYYAASPTSLPDNPPGLPTRETDITYGYNVNGLLFPTKVEERDSTGAVKSSVISTYDEPAYMSGAAPSTTPNHNNAYVTGNRGNATTISKCCGWDGTSFVTLTSHMYYDDAGVVTATVDAKGNRTTFQHDATDLNPQVITLPPTGTPEVSHVTSKTFDFNSGQVHTITDENNRTTTYNVDSLGRPSSIQLSTDGIPVTLQTTTYPSTNEIDVSVLQSPGVFLSSTTIVDSYGRTVQQVQSGVSTETNYDAQGRRYSTTNAHLDTPSSTDGTSYYYYDELGRTKSVKMPSGFSTTYTYSQNSVTIQDPTGRSRQITSDTFGDIASVLEPNTSGVLAYTSSYEYNWQGQITTIQQQGGTSDATQWRQRTFSYDGVGELVSQTTKEAGTTSFAYDSNGNLINTTNQDSAQNTTSYSYDNLNRLISETVGGGPTYTYTYDAQDSSADPFGKGVLTGTSDGTSVKTLYQHDSLGRVTSTAYCLPSESDCSFATHVQTQYDFQGNLTSLTYPDGRNIQLAYDLLNRPISQTYAKFGTNTVGTPYVSNLLYYPGGQFQQATIGSAIQTGATYDPNQNLSSLVYTVNGTPIAEKTYTWDTNAADLLSVNDLASGRTQSYTYDQMSRLTTMNDTGTTTNACTAGLPGISATSQTYSIDPWGNLQQGGTFTFSQSTGKDNRLSPGQGYVYDAAGNQTQDALGNTYTYRSDGLITGSGGLTYSYDALGQRVRKAAGSSSTEYIYFGGQLLAMRDSSGNWTDRIYGPTGALATVPGTQAGQPTYRVSDHLGSLNYTLDPSGTINGASSVYPFGQMASNSTGDNFVFTDHERDTENNSDATLYRHYASAQGRWLSPDPSNGSYDLADPQSFNRYSYVNNRPITSVDELGLDDGDCTCPCSGGGGGDPGGGDDGSHFDPWHWAFGWPDPAPIYRNPNKGVSLATQLNALPGGINAYFLTKGFNGQSTGASLGNWSTDYSLGLFPTDVAITSGYAEVNWRLRTSNGEQGPGTRYLVFEHLVRRDGKAFDRAPNLTQIQRDGTAIGPFHDGAARPSYVDNSDLNVFRDSYGGLAKQDFIQYFTVQVLRDNNDLIYDPKRQIHVPIRYGGKIFGSQGLYHEGGGYAPIFVNGYHPIPGVPRLRGQSEY